MNRRKFLNFIGSAIIGTAIALKLPDSIVPTRLFERPTISFTALYDAFKESTFVCSRGTFYPTNMWVGKSAFEEAKRLMLEHSRFGVNGLSKPEEISSFSFMNARLEANSLLDEDEIHTAGELFGNLGRYRFV